MNKEEQLFVKRIQELGRMAYQKDIVMFTDFMNLHYVHLLQKEANAIPGVRVEFFGGYEGAERQIGAFIPDDLCYEYSYPMEILKIEPLHLKFAEQLNHRDYLGAILNSGIDRSKVGDILCSGSCAYVFCMDSMVDFLRMELTRIRHTEVKVSQVTCAELPEQRFQEITGSVASERLDCMMALAFRNSRSSMDKLAVGEKVMVNGEVVTSNSQILQVGDVVSVRGYGKFRYSEKMNLSKKNRLFVKVERYV